MSYKRKKTVCGMLLEELYGVVSSKPLYFYSSNFGETKKQQSSSDSAVSKSFSLISGLNSLLKSVQPFIDVVKAFISAVSLGKRFARLFRQGRRRGIPVDVISSNASKYAKMVISNMDMDRVRRKSIRVEDPDDFARSLSKILLSSLKKAIEKAVKSSQDKDFIAYGTTLLEVIERYPRETGELLYKYVSQRIMELEGKH